MTLHFISSIFSTRMLRERIVARRGKMPMTELDAQKKWCPFSKVAVASGKGYSPGAPFGYNRNMHQDEKDNGCPTAARCIASHCMAWRWHEAGFILDGTDDKGLIFRRHVAELTYGSCGLAREEF